VRKNVSVNVDGNKSAVGKRTVVTASVALEGINAGCGVPRTLVGRVMMFSCVAAARAGETAFSSLGGTNGSTLFSIFDGALYRNRRSSVWRDRKEKHY
jgi:hypothetical protein